MEKYTLVCPVRGQLSTSGKSSDGLTPNEEYYRVEAITYLIDQGYPKENFRVEVVERRFGNSGRNSFRCDFVVLDCPSSEIGKDPDEVLRHAVILCEVKRDRSKRELVENTQVKPMLDFAKREDAIGIYWADVEQRIYWHENVDGIIEEREAPLSYLPPYGSKVAVSPLTFATIQPTSSLTDVFSKIEDILHAASLDKEKRYEVIFQLLLAKIFDEHSFETRPDQPLDIQDFSALGTSPSLAMEKMSKVVDRAVTYYQSHLPNKVSNKLRLPDDSLSEILKILAPIKIVASKRDVVQTFYMKFAKDLYKWDMAQYFTPTAVTDFIIDVLNPQFGEHVCDPACGSADFLVGAFRYGRQYNPGYADCVWGFDNSENAVQVAVLNMVLNGDGKSNIKKLDSLKNIKKNEGRFDVVVCNPPFGSKIVETRKEVLKMFDLGHSWSFVDDEFKKGNVLDKQEDGILFIEACVRLCRKDRGRIAIILPNGYLGNRSDKFSTMREWLLRHVRISAIVSLPRFTFKQSGADVSASIVFMEKRAEVLDDPKSDVYPVAIEMIEKLGWTAGDSKGKPVYKRNMSDGSLVIENGEPIIDNDFAKSLKAIISSGAGETFAWLRSGRESEIDEAVGWTISSSDFFTERGILLDPKYFCKKNQTHLDELRSDQHFFLGDKVDIVQERRDLSGSTVCSKPDKTYHYVELADINNGDHHSNRLKGWELPDRARHFAEPRDFFFGSIWGSVQKWCVIADDETDVVVTNGCFRCHMKPGEEDYLIDVISYMTTESWATQARALARGSDGLAEIYIEDAKDIVIPELSDSARDALRPTVERMLEGRSTLSGEVEALVKDGRINYCEIEKRASHIVLV